MCCRIMFGDMLFLGIPRIHFDTWTARPMPLVDEKTKGVNVLCHTLNFSYVTWGGMAAAGCMEVEKRLHHKCPFSPESLCSDIRDIWLCLACLLYMSTIRELLPHTLSRRSNLIQGNDLLGQLQRMLFIVILLKLLCWMHLFCLPKECHGMQVGSH